MADLNKVMLIGRLTRDPQMKYLPSQTAVCEFGLAVGRKFKAASGEMREETNFVDCTLFGKGAEVFNQYMAKGKQVFLEGRLKFDSWDDKQGGGKRSKLTVVVEEFQFLGSKSEGDDTDQTRPPSRPFGQRPPKPQGEPVPPYSEGPDMDPDDIPFASAHH